MGRPTKDGLDYFPLDIDFWDDPKLLMAEEKFGLEGSYIANRLLCWIYRNGYYATWDEDTALVFARRIGHGVTGERADQVVQALIRVDFLDRKQYENNGILTSNGIQTRWTDIIRRAKRKCSIKEEYRTGAVNVPIAPVSSEETTRKREETPPKQEESTQSKVKESKVIYILIAGQEVELVDLISRFENDIGLQRNWAQKGLPSDKFLHGIELFAIWNHGKKYETQRDAKEHFMYWTPNYHRAAAGAKPPQNNGTTSTTTAKKHARGEAGQLAVLEALKKDYNTD